MRSTHLLSAAALLALGGSVDAQNSSTKRGYINLAPSANWPKSAAQDYRIFISEPSDLTWYYNYQAEPTPALKNLAPNLTFVPMLWGIRDTTDTSFLDTITAAVKAGQKIDSVLFFNEPDGTSATGGSNIDPETAAKVWRKQFEPIKSLRGASIGGNGVIKLGGPAVTGAPTGLQWLKDFRAACDNLGGCSVDFLPAHWYDNFEGLASHIGEKQSTFTDWGREIWVTEYAYANQDLTNTQAFYKQSAEYFDRMAAIKRYSWFGGFRSSVSNVGPNVAFLDGYGKLTDLGAWYLGRPSTGVLPTLTGDSTKAFISLPIMGFALLLSLILTLI